MSGLSPAEQLTIIAELQAEVRVATFERQRAADRRRQNAASTSWETVAQRRREESFAIATRDRWLNAITAHQKEWAHLATDCPLCRPRDMRSAQEQIAADEILGRDQ